MIHVYGRPDPPLPRLVEALVARGHALRAPGGSDAPVPADRSGGSATLVLAPGAELDVLALGVLLGAWRRTEGGRVLVVSPLGTHPDARTPRLRRAWELEEQARGFALPVLTLRLAPLLGPHSPLWLRLRSRPRLPRHGRGVLNPVAESDALETLDRALTGRADWRGWYEVAGPEAIALGELAALARDAGPRLPFGAGAWEPPLEELAEHRLAESGPWTTHFGIAPRPLAEQVVAWAA